MHYKWLLFDADSTLFDYEQAEASALEGTFHHMGVTFDPTYLEKYRKINQRIWRALEAGRISPQALRTRRFELLFRATELSLSPEAFSAAYLHQLAACSQLLDGAYEVVQVLHRKYALAIGTNGLKDVQRPRLEKSIIRQFFQVMVISEEVGAAKPDSAFFDAAFAYMGNPRKEEVMMIGDNFSADIQGGSKYGIATCWFNPAHLPRSSDVNITFEIQHLAELLNIL